MLDFSILIAAAAPPFLFEAVSLIAVGALIAYICSRLGLVPIVGFLVAGVVIGPNALGLVTNQALVDQAAELGVMLLLFTIGIEFSLERLARIQGLIFGGGGLQVALATAVTAGGVMLAGGSWQAGIFSGFLVALSSTAIVTKLLGDWGETRTPYGRLGVAMLIFQDLGIIAMVLLLPSLAGAAGGAADVAVALLSAAGLIFAVLLVARRIMPKVLEKVALTCSQEVFLLTVIAICLGTAYLTSLAGVSVSLGAFLAGLVVSESRFSHHALTEILPLQILFSAVFFVSVGMLLDLSFLLANPLPVIGVILGVLLVKILTTGAAALVLRQPLPVALGSSLLLAQVGEFSFVLERAGRDLGLVPFGLEQGGSQIFVASTVGLMVVTPFLAQLGSRLAAKDVEEEQPTGDEGAPAIDEEAFEALRDHVLVAGYASSARRLCAALKEHGVPFVIVTLSPSGATEAESRGMLVLRGDNARAETLRHAGIERARMVVVADDAPARAHVVATVARQAAPEVKILVRTRLPVDAPAITEAGADAVASDELESTLRLCGEVLSSYGMDAESLERHVDQVRELAQTGRLDDLPPDSPEAEAHPQRRADLDLETPVELPADPQARCSHQDQVLSVLPSAQGCEECLKTGDRWVHLRVCMTCGHVGCCDSSPNKHATAHFHATSHPIIRSLEPGETWGWCYVDKETL